MHRGLSGELHRRFGSADRCCSSAVNRRCGGSSDPRNDSEQPMRDSVGTYGLELLLYCFFFSLHLCVVATVVL